MTTFTTEVDQILGLFSRRNFALKVRWLLDFVDVVERILLKVLIREVDFVRISREGYETVVDVIHFVYDEEKTEYHHCWESSKRYI